MRLVYTVVREFQANSIEEEIQGFKDYIAPDMHNCLYKVGYDHWDTALSVKMDVLENEQWKEVANKL